jgi:hypothetical protein
MNKNMIEQEFKKELHINNDEQQKFVYIWINEYPIHDINYNSIMITPTYIHLYNAHDEIITSFARADWDDIYYSSNVTGHVMDAVPLINCEECK